MLLLTQLAYTRPFISSGGALVVRNSKSSRHFIHPFPILAGAARSAPPLHQECLPDNKSALYIHIFLRPPLGLQLDQLLGLSHHIAYAWNRQLPATSFPEFTTIFPPLLLTITFEFHVFTFSALSRKLALHSAIHLPSCSIVGAISTKTSTYRNSEGRPLLASLETTSMTTTNSSGLRTDPWCKPTFTSKLLFTPASELQFMPVYTIT